MDFQELQQKLYNKLKNSGWNQKLKLFILSQDFTNILTELYTQSQNNKKFTPVLKNLFRAFEECPYDKLKLVMVAVDPYPQLNVADGIAFSCKNCEKEQPSLRYWHDEIHRTVYPQGKEINAVMIPREDYDKDLKYLSNQGVLLLNSSLTCQIDNTGTHTELWRPFMTYLLTTLNDFNKGLIYVFIGQKAMPWHTYIDSNNYKFFTTHPASIGFINIGKWDTGDMFNHVNKLLKKNGHSKIIW